jgi:NADH:ubiquinone oxidoreductase subunit F (NADH-binding)
VREHPGVSTATVAPPALEVARLLAGAEDRSLGGHLDRYGWRPRGTKSLIAEVERSGLRGRGGAAFPTAVKLRSVAGRRQPVVVANGTEGEPLSAKDKVLMTRVPHLVLDGAAVVAETVGATRILLCLERSAGAAASAMQAAVAERRPFDDVEVEVLGTPSRFVAGEETALIHWLNGGEAKPTMVPPRPFERGVGGRPSLVQNVETLAHVALIARFGAGWFRALGTAGDPGTRLLTVTGGVAAPGIVEVESGISLLEALDAAGWVRGPLPAVLVGGYFGAWLDPEAVGAAHLDVESMRAMGSSPGCGVVWVLPPGVCGLVESARVARWYADQSAGQCGPCFNGLPAIADALAALVSGSRPAEAAVALRRWLPMVTGRGACRHPDGAVRFVSSTLRVFADEVDRHARYGPCAASQRAAVLPVVSGGGWR